MNLTLIVIVLIALAAVILIVFLLFFSRIKHQLILSNALMTFSQQTSEQHQDNLLRLQLLFKENFSTLTDQFDKLNQSMHQRLLSISEAVEIKLAKGFEKTNETFIAIIERLALIDEAQKKISALSENVIELQAILTDKRARGAFGEVQLHILIQNVLPTQSYHLQHTLSNGTRVDCLLLLPEPNGKIAIDAKFPLENYQKYINSENTESTRITAKQQFKLDIRKHIQAISQKYIIPNETSEGALMFIPAEAIFAEIHAHHPDLVEFAWQMRVWIASPSTMMAILTTASAVLKDAATRQQIHVIQAHLKLLAQDFGRFEKRMENLTRHLQQANQDADLISTSAQKISKRFYQIEKAEIASLEEEKDL